MGIQNRYIENKNRLIKKLSTYDEDILVNSEISDFSVCYFCLKKIPDGSRLFRIVYSSLDSRENITEENYAIDEGCMENIRKR